jgi:DNA-binding winged helix-turn-helix (wHTH) protein
MICKALGEVPGEHRYIVTVPGRGYRFSAEGRGWSQGDADVVIEDHSRAEMVIGAEEGDQEEMKERAQAESWKPAPYPAPQIQAAPARSRRLAVTTP